MSKILRWIAVVGLGIGVVSLAVAYALGGRDLSRLWDRTALTLQACGDGKAKTDSATERRLAWNGGDTIDIALPAMVRLHVGEGNELVVRGSPDTIAHVELRDGRLTLNCRWLAASRDLEVTLPGRVFRRVGISGSAKVVIENLSQPDLAIAISGSGSLAAQGTVERLSVVISGSGNAKLAEVAAKQLTAKISGSGNVEAAPKEDADINVSGSGNVRLLTRPAHLSSHVSGSGRISQAERNMQ
jgi:hypothetical protein